MKTFLARPALLLAILAVFVAAVPVFFSSFAVSLLNDVGIASLVALGLVLLTGIGGATSFGQAAFVGIAAYASAWLTTAQGMSPWLGLLFALTLTAVPEPSTYGFGIGALALALAAIRRRRKQIAAAKKNEA